VIVVAGLLVYSNSLSSPFLFDDQNSIIGNLQIRRLWPLSIPLSPPRDTPVAGRPLVNLSFAINYAVGGLDPWGYHLANIVIHVTAALVLFGLVRRTLETGGLKASGYRSSDIAFVCALLWLLHPLNSEAVNYFSQRTESMMGLFYLLTLYFSVRKWNAAAVIACALGMACKESMVTAPIVVMLYDRIFVFESWKQMMRERRGLYTGLAATWLVLAALMSSTPRTSVGFGAGTSPLVYLLNQCEMIARYLRLAVWPRDLVLDYGLPRPLAFTDVLPQAALIVALGLATIVALIRWPMLGFLGAWFFITLAPTSSFVPIATEVGAERRMYLPLAALIVLFVIAIYKIIRAPRAAAGVAVCACVLLAAGTLIRNREYSSSLSLARTVVDRWPSGRGHFLLGTELLTARQREAGMTELRASATDYPGARYALGTEYLSEGRMDAAIEELDAFIAALPGHANVAPARDMLGRAFAAQGRFGLATDQFERLLRDYPGYPGREEVRRLIEQIRNARFPRS
jgi:protein O-mannosyl-transferase